MKLQNLAHVSPQAQPRQGYVGSVTKANLSKHDLRNLEQSPQTVPLERRGGLLGMGAAPKFHCGGVTCVVHTNIELPKPPKSNVKFCTAMQEFAEGGSARPGALSIRLSRLRNWPRAWDAQCEQRHTKFPVIISHQHSQFSR